MFKFDYEYLEACVPFVTCIVPENWLALKLPRFGGNVVYESDVVALPKSADSIFTPDYVSPPKRIYSQFVFELSETAGAEGLFRIISLEIKRESGAVDQPTHEKIVGPVSIRCRHLEKHQSNNGWDVPIVLLNHLLGGIAGSIPVGMSWLDFGDVFDFLEAHHELQFEFAGGNDVGEISSCLRQHLEGDKLEASFPMIYLSNLCSLEDIDIVTEALESNLIYVPSVKGQQKFISWLFV